MGIARRRRQNKFKGEVSFISYSPTGKSSPSCHFVLEKSSFSGKLFQLVALDLTRQILRCRALTSDTRSLVVASYHEYQVVPRQPVVRLLEDGLQQQRVLGQPLHRPHEDVEEAEPVAVLLRLAPRQVGLEDLVLAVLVAAVLLAVGLLGAVTRVRREDLLELRKRRKRKISFFVAAAESIESINEMIQVES